MASPYSIEGAGVFLPARIAAGLEREFRLDAFRVKVRGRDRELDEVLLALHGTAAAWIETQRDLRQFRSDGTGVDELRNLTDAWSTEEVAARSGCTCRAVTKAASAGQLIGARLAGRWRFRPEDVAQWRATRKRGDR